MIPETDKDAVKHESYPECGVRASRSADRSHGEAKRRGEKEVQ